MKPFEASYLKSAEEREKAAFEKIDPSKVEIVKLAIEGKDSETRLSLLEKFSVEFKKAEGFGGQPNGNGNPPAPNDSRNADLKGKSFKDALATGLQNAFQGK